MKTSQTVQEWKETDFYKTAIFAKNFCETYYIVAFY